MYFYKLESYSKFCMIGDLSIKYLYKQFSCLFNDIYFFKLRIKGLGFRIRTISENFHYIFFNYTNYIIFILLKIL